MSKNNGATSKVSSLIPNNVKQIIQDIKEIVTSNHTEDDIYAMLKDCSMDPNETTQRLLLLDTFQEVKRKRDKKKEAVKSKSGEEFRWRSGHQGRGTRTTRGNTFSQHSSNDARGWRIQNMRKENGVQEGREKGLRHSHTLLSKETDSIHLRDREKLSSHITNGSLELPNGRVSCGHGVQLSKIPEAHLCEEKVNVSADSASSIVPKTSVERAPALDPVLVFPRDSWVSAVVSTKQEVPVRQTAEPSSIVAADGGIDPTDNHLKQHEVERCIGSQLPSSTCEKQLLEPVEAAHPKISDECPVADKSHGPGSVAVVKPSSRQGVRNATAKLEKLKFSEGQHVIIPQHIQVPDEVKNVLSFGSLDANFGGRENCVKNGSNETSNYVVNPAQEDTVSKFDSCDLGANSTASQANHVDHPQSPLHLPDQNPPGALEVPSSAIVPEDGQPKQENLPAVGPPFPVVQTTPIYSFGFMPPMLASVLAQPEGVESQAHALSPLGEISVTTSTSTPPPTGAGQSSVGASPQPFHVFRQHYPPNYMPYGHYFSPFYVPPGMHQYFGHTAFPPPLPTGSMYVPLPTAAPGLKVSPTNLKPGTLAGAQAPFGVPSIYGAYSTTPVGYIQNATVSSGNSTNAEDLGPPALKESNIYPGHQSEGSAMWLPQAGGEAANFRPNSFLNFPSHGQQHLLNPQSGHGSFTVYHTLQPMGGPAQDLPLLQQSQPVAGSAESVGPPNSYQQPQHQQPINWNM